MNDWEPVSIRKIKSELRAANDVVERTHADWQEATARRDRLAKELREETERILGALWVCTTG